MYGTCVELVSIDSSVCPKYSSHRKFQNNYSLPSSLPWNYRFRNGRLLSAEFSHKVLYLISSTARFAVKINWAFCLFLLSVSDRRLAVSNTQETLPIRIHLNSYQHNVNECHSFCNQKDYEYTLLFIVCHVSHFTSAKTKKFGSLFPGVCKKSTENVSPAGLLSARLATRIDFFEMLIRSTSPLLYRIKIYIIKTLVTVHFKYRSDSFTLLNIQYMHELLVLFFQCFFFHFLFYSAVCLLEWYIIYVHFDYILSMSMFLKSGRISRLIVDFVWK